MAAAAPRRDPRRWQAIQIAEWHGLNEDENPNTLQLGELLVAENVWRLGGTIGTRPGTVRDPDGDYDAAISGAPAVTGLFEFRRSFDSARVLVAVAGSNLYSTDSTTFTGAVTVTAGQDNLWTFAEHKDQVFAAGGANGDSLWRWTGTGNAAAVTLQSDTNADGVADANVDAKFIFQKWNYGFLAGMNGSVPDDNPMTVRYSALGDMTSWPIGNTIGGSSAIGGLSAYGGEFTTGLAEHTDNQGDWLLILTNRKLYSVLQTSNPLSPFFIDSEIANGCVSQAAFVNLGTDSGDSIYLSEDGIHSLRQSQQHGARQDRFLSWKIRTTFRSLRRDRLKYASGAYDPDHGIVVFLVTTGANTAHDLLLVLDVKGQDEVTAENARWYRWRLSGISANRVVSARGVDGKRGIYLGTTNGNVLRFTLDRFDDLTVGYVARLQTHHDDLGAPGVVKVLGDIYMQLQPGGDYNPRVRAVFDFGQSPTESIPLDMQVGSEPSWGAISWNEFAWSSTNTTQRERVPGWGAGETISLEIVHAGTNQPFRIASLTYEARALGRGAESLASATG
jgi:hypothetical protein